MTTLVGFHQGNRIGEPWSLAVGDKEGIVGTTQRNWGGAVK